MPAEFKWAHLLRRVNARLFLVFTWADPPDDRPRDCQRPLPLTRSWAARADELWRRLRRKGCEGRADRTRANTMAAADLFRSHLDEQKVAGRATCWPRTAVGFLSGRHLCNRCASPGQPQAALWPSLGARRPPVGAGVCFGLLLAGESGRGEQQVASFAAASNDRWRRPGCSSRRD